MNYFISDLHFGHRKIIEFERKQFATIEEHDKYYLELIKNKMTKDDTLYVLGDVGFIIPEEFKTIPGKKVLIMGNHDRNTKVYYETNGFNEVYVHPVFIAKRIVLSHEPIPVTDEVLNVHGHLHNSIIDKKNYLNVNVFLTDSLVTEKKLNRMMSGLPKISHKFKEEWYAPLYKYITNVEDFEGKLDSEGHLIL